jgi:hypothetical protein
MSGFEDLEAESATACLHWEKMKVPFRIALETHDIVLQSMRDELRGRLGFGWQGWNAAAHYCLRNNINHAEALQWIDQKERIQSALDSFQGTF